MNKELQTIAVWATTKRLLQIAAALAGTSQVQFLHDAILEKVRRDMLPVPEQYLVDCEGNNNE
jgi:hypothetical protein